jgi:hypothetical protein
MKIECSDLFVIFTYHMELRTFFIYDIEFIKIGVNPWTEFVIFPFFFFFFTNL